MPRAIFSSSSDLLIQAAHIPGGYGSWCSRLSSRRPCQRYRRGGPYSVVQHARDAAGNPSWGPATHWQGIHWQGMPGGTGQVSSCGRPAELQEGPAERQPVTSRPCREARDRWLPAACQCTRREGRLSSLNVRLQGMTGAIRRAEDIVRGTPGAYMLQQFDNPANPEVHYKST